MIDLNSILNDSPYHGYAYSYPHKSAYRTFDNPFPLEQVWENESRDSLFLYLHVPFCEYRCGFCNLFTMAGADDTWTDLYLSQLATEASALATVLPEAQFARVAIGGGTPTFLDEGQLAQLLEIVNRLTGTEKMLVPASCEASPATLTEVKARLLRDWGVDRLSLGVQTFDDRESRTLGRPQTAIEIKRAIEVARRAEFPVLNLDLIYGSSAQSYESWMRTVTHALSHYPEEIYLYPLYVRDLTGLGQVGATPRDDRLAHYRGARDRLLDAGYEQVSMRMFRLPRTDSTATPVYCCQSDGMVGLGCGARSYTQQLHYSSDFAVGRNGVRSILNNYLQRSSDSFHYAHYGILLDENERKRRFVLQGLLQREGLSMTAYEARFGGGIFDDLPDLSEFIVKGLAQLEADQFKLTSRGMERSDAIGPWLYSPKVKERMEAFECV